MTYPKSWYPVKMAGLGWSKRTKIILGLSKFGWKDIMPRRVVSKLNILGRVKGERAPTPRYWYCRESRGHQYVLGNSKGVTGYGK